LYTKKCVAPEQPTHEGLPQSFEPDPPFADDLLRAVAPATSPGEYMSTGRSSGLPSSRQA
jgi:hypothetical protein